MSGIFDAVLEAWTELSLLPVYPVAIRVLKHSALKGELDRIVDGIFTASEGAVSFPCIEYEVIDVFNRDEGLASFPVGLMRRWYQYGETAWMELSNGRQVPIVSDGPTH